MADKTLFSYGKTRLLPKTGQTTSYTNYDDGYYEDGNRAAPRFVDNIADGTISDRATGLMWTKNSQLIVPTGTGLANFRADWTNDTGYAYGDLAKDSFGANDFWVCLVAHTSAVKGSFTDDRAANPTYWIQTVWSQDAFTSSAPAFMTWADAITNCEALNYAGFTDWRLPNVNELVSIANYESSPAVYSTYFPNIPVATGDEYWSSTTHANYTTAALCVWYWEGTNGPTASGIDKTWYRHVIPVRGGR